MIEMLVVVLLVAILAAVALPLYSSYNTSIREQEGRAAALNVLTAAKVYYNRNGESFTGSNCDCTANNIWLNTGEICNHWTISYPDPDPQRLSVTVTNKADNSMFVTVIFNATLGSTIINGQPS